MAKRRVDLHSETQEVPGAGTGEHAAEGAIPGLTVVWHPDPARVGEETRLPGLLRGEEVALSRVSPELNKPGSHERWPIADPFLSRKPAFLEKDGEGFLLRRPPDAVAVTVDGEVAGERTRIPAEDVARGVVLELGGRVSLLFHPIPPRGDGLPAMGLIGESAAMVDVRRNILRVADTDVPVLLRGETGTGKELVAGAIHAAGHRAPHPHLSVNMAAVQQSLAASELFGYVKGAFTGAAADHPGYFRRADHGTLFLDEIGETPIDVQVMLLRTLETGRILPLGSRAEETVDVRVLSATDADLDAMVREQRFRPALLHRLAGYEIAVPPLRARRDDIGRLFLHFLRAELERIGEASRLEVSEAPAKPWIPASLISQLVRHDWPGNVRQLRNVTRQLAITNRGAKVMKMDPAVERQLAEKTPPRAESRASSARSEEPAPAAPAPRDRRKPSEVTEAELVEALKANRWRIEQTAAQLRITRPSLYMLIEKSQRIRKAKDVPRDEIKKVHDELGGDVDAMAARLEVSPRGLHLRLKEIL